MNLGLQNRVAFVSGASSGLGLATAIELAREGCRVVIAARDEGRLQSAAAEIIAQANVHEAFIHHVVCDVTDERRIETAVGEAVQRFGKLEILVTNAGGPPAGFVDDLDAAAWRAALELSLMGTVNLCRHALPHLRAAVAQPDGLGRIVMITSISAKQPIPNLYLSNAARAGVQGFAKSLSEELGPTGITVNTVLPGYNRTERLVTLARAAQERTGKSVEEIEAGWAAGSALKRIGEPEEVAAAVAFLASRRGSYITGIALPVDGGASKALL